jgi:hypothetical protein
MSFVEKSGMEYHFLPISSKCVTNQTRAPLLIIASAMAMAIAKPSLVPVPRPSSSMIARLSLSALLTLGEYFGQCRAQSVLPQHEGHLAHFNGKCGQVTFEAVVKGHTCKEASYNRKCCEFSWNETANLGHDLQQRDSPNITALPTHVAPSDYMEPAQLGCVKVVWHELIRKYLELGQPLAKLANTSSKWHSPCLARDDERLSERVSM